MSGGSEEQASPAQPADAEEEVYEAEAEIEAEVEDESGDLTGLAGAEAAAAAAAASAPRRPLRMPPRRNTGGGLKATAAPVLMTVGILMLVPAVWAVLHLSGAMTSEKHDADAMAKVMLFCWPIALALIASGIVFMLQTAKEKKNR